MLLDYQAIFLSEGLDQDDTDVQTQPEIVNDRSELRTNEASGVRVYLLDTDFAEVEYMELLTAVLNLCAEQVHKFVNLLSFVKIFKLLCHYVVKTLSPVAQMNFERYHSILVLYQNQEHLEGVEILRNLRNLRNSVSFCIESLVGLARCFQQVEDLLRKCGSLEWYKAALELADERPPRRVRRWSEFSLVIRNCKWSLDLVELAFHALERLLSAGTHTMKDASFECSEEKGRMVLEIPGKLEIENSSQENALLEVCRDLEEKDLAALTQELEKLVVSEKVQKRFYQGLSSAHNISYHLNEKLKGLTSGIGTYLPYSFSSKIDPLSLKYLEYLDKGSSGMVAIYEWNGIKVAVKNVRFRDMSRTKFEQEAAVLGMVQHPNVVRHIGCGFIEKTSTGLLVMELMEHDLRTIIKSRLKVLPKGSSPFSPTVAIDIMLQIGQAMRHLREFGILHRDLKTKNILVNLVKPLYRDPEADSANTSSMTAHLWAVLQHTEDHYVAKVTGFELAKCSPKSSFVKTFMVGTTEWRAPEVFNLRGPEVNQTYTWAADVFSFAMTCYEILTGRMPFEDEADYGVGLHLKIMEGVRPPLDNLKPNVPEALKELIQQCWATELHHRPSFDQIVKKLWKCKMQTLLPEYEQVTLTSDVYPLVYDSQSVLCTVCGIKLPSEQFLDSHLNVHNAKRVPNVTAQSGGSDATFTYNRMNAKDAVVADSRTGVNDTGISGQAISFQLQSKDLPSRRLLGKGLSGIGYETSWNKERFARKDFLGVPKDIFEKEAIVLVGLNDHENIVKTYGWTVDKRSCSLVLEYMDNDLLSFLQKRTESEQDLPGMGSGNQSFASSLTQPLNNLLEALDIMFQISRGMEFLHEQGVAHGDLKTKNILVTHMNGGNHNLKLVKVTDFGLIWPKRRSKSKVSRLVRKLDIVQWKAPEHLKRIFRQLKLSTDEDETSSESDSIPNLEKPLATPLVVNVIETSAFAADVYSFAVMCSQILTGKAPYPNLHWKDLGDQILSSLRPRLPNACPPLLRNLLISCWDNDPAQRPSFSEIRKSLEHRDICASISASFILQLC